MVLRGRSRAARFTGVRCATRARLPWPLQAPSFMGPLHMLFTWLFTHSRFSLFNRVDTIYALPSGLFLYVNRLDDQFAASRIAVVWSGVRVRVGRRARAGGRPRPATRGPGSAGAAAGTGTVV